MEAGSRDNYSGAPRTVTPGHWPFAAPLLVSFPPPPPPSHRIWPSEPDRGAATYSQRWDWPRPGESSFSIDFALRRRTDTAHKTGAYFFPSSLQLTCSISKRTAPRHTAVWSSHTFSAAVSECIITCHLRQLTSTLLASPWNYFISKADAAVCVLRLQRRWKKKPMLRLTDIVWRLPLMHTKMAHTALHLDALIWVAWQCSVRYWSLTWDLCPRQYLSRQFGVKRVQQLET